MAFRLEMLLIFIFPILGAQVENRQIEQVRLSHWNTGRVYTFRNHDNFDINR